MAKKVLINHFVGKMNLSDMRVSFFMSHTHYVKTAAAPLECNNIPMFTNMIRVDGFSVKLYKT